MECLKLPEISVLMSVFNEKLEWIKLAVDSILNQTFTDFEFIIIIDNPDLKEEIESYLKSIQLNDSRIIILKNDINMGLASCLNKGLAIAQGEYIARMDADDISYIDRFEKQIKYIKETNSDMVSGLRVEIDENGNIIREIKNNYHEPKVFLPYSNYIVHPSVLMKKDKLLALNGYRLFSKSQDYDLWLRMLSEGYKISILDEYVINYRVRANSISVSNELEQYYISEYQKKLYKERIKKGKDTFTLDNLDKFLLSKKITTKKNNRYSKSRTYMNDAIFKIKNKKITFLKSFIRSFLLFPEIGINTIKFFCIKVNNK